MIHRFAAPALLACAFALSVPDGLARTDDEVEYTCPIDGQKFKWMTAMSGTMFGARLDSRPIGPIAIPEPYPVCPGNGFVLYRSERELDADYVTKAKALVASAEYKRICDSETPHFLAAYIAEQLGEERLRIVGLQMEAAWDAEDHRQEKHAVYLRAAVAKIRAWQAATTERDGNWTYRQIVIAEMLRQAGDFDDSKAALAEAPADLVERLTTGKQRLQQMIEELHRRIRTREKAPI